MRRYLPLLLLPLLCALAGRVLPRPAAAQGGALPRPDHVVIVVEENHGYSPIIGDPAAPYMNALARQGACFTDSYAVAHPSQPNYLALFSGSTQGVTDDGCDYTFSTPNLARSLLDAGFSFAGYSEDLPRTGYTGCSSGGYARKHAPWVDWQEDLVSSGNSIPTECSQPCSQLPDDFSALPTVSFVIPNLDHDMHDGTIQEADTWLRQNLDPYVRWAQTHNSLLIVTWDEDDGGEGNRIPTLFVGPMVNPGQYGERISHYEVLRSVEDMYGLPRLGNSAAAASIADVWDTLDLPAPSLISARRVAPARVRLTWQGSAPDGGGFKILRSTDRSTFVRVASVGPRGNGYTDAGLARGRTYFYRIRAYGPSGSSPDSNTLSVKTAPR